MIHICWLWPWKMSAAMKTQHKNEMISEAIDKVSSHPCIGSPDLTQNEDAVVGICKNAKLWLR
jgi:hypothetical protein